jgi:hypothetical protein
MRFSSSQNSALPKICRSQIVEAEEDGFLCNFLQSPSIIFILCTHPYSMHHPLSILVLLNELLLLDMKRILWATLNTAACFSLHQ